MAKHQFKVGDQLWLVRFNNSGESRYVTVTKVGSKWVYIDHGNPQHRFNPETMMLDGHGYNSPGKCWHSKEGYETWHNARLAWASLRQDMNNLTVPQDITPEKVADARRILGLTA